MPKERWYKDGLSFNCTQCGDCCTGAPGYVWVSPEEIKELAKVTGESSTDDFERKYVMKVGNRKSLKELPQANFDCVFLDPETRGCMVYEARPQQCRTWPFWDSNLSSKTAWKEAAAACPGCNQGKLYGIDEIEERRKTVKV